jgi:hypothetical protein
MAEMIENYKTLRIDSKGRVSLGKLACEGVSSYKAHLDERTNRIILEPYAEVPLKEAWLFKNKSALRRLHKGLKQSSEGNTRHIGSFSQYIDEKSNAL